MTGKCFFKCGSSGFSFVFDSGGPGRRIPLLLTQVEFTLNAFFFLFFKRPHFKTYLLLGSQDLTPAKRGGGGPLYLWLQSFERTPYICQCCVIKQWEATPTFQTLPPCFLPETFIFGCFELGSTLAAQNQSL